MRLLRAIFANALLLAASFGVGSLLAPLFPGKLSRLDRFASMVAGDSGCWALCFSWWAWRRFRAQ